MHVVCIESGYVVIEETIRRLKKISHSWGEELRGATVRRNKKKKNVKHKTYSFVWVI